MLPDQHHTLQAGEAHGLFVITSASSLDGASEHKPRARTEEHRMPHGTKMKLPKQEPPKVVGSWQGGCWCHLSQSRRLLCFLMANSTFQWASAGCPPWLIPTEGYGEGRTPPSLHPSIHLLLLPSLQKDPHYTSVFLELPACSWSQREPPDGEMRPCQQRVRPAPGLSNAPMSSCRRVKKLTHAKPGFKGP